MKINNKIFALLVIFLMMFSVKVNFAQNNANFLQTSSLFITQEKTTPETAEEHLAKAESYKKHAAEYRAVAEEHRQMKKDYAKKIYQHPKDRIENPWLKKMRIHCDKFIVDAETLANEADKMAEYHTLRAKELQGK